MKPVIRRCRHWLLALAVLTGVAPGLHAAAPGCFSAPAGLIGWWSGDGTANDIAGTNNGTLQGGATASAAGLVGSAFSFDGNNGYVQIPDSPVLRPTNLTVEAWVLFSSLESAGSGATPAGQQYIVFKQNTRSSYFEGYNLSKIRVTGGDALAFLISSALGQLISLQSTTHVATGVWYHVAGVRGSNFVQLYVNGQLESQTNITFAQDYGNFPLYFGTSGETYWDRKLNGLLDEVSLYDHALASNEIAAVYAAGAAGKCKAPGLTAQPQSQAVVMGTNALFTVTATGFGTLSYQWRFNGTNIAGATSANLALNNVQWTNAGSYTVVVTNSLGSATSTVATLTVVCPTVTLSPATLPAGLVGNAYNQSLTASGGFGPYTFAVTAGTLPTGLSLSDAGVLNGMPATIGTNSFIVTAWDTNGCSGSQACTLAVTGAPPIIAQQPQSRTNILGTDANFSVTASGTPAPAYQWQFNGAAIPGATGSTLLRSAVSFADAGSYRVVLTNVAGAVTSTVATLTVVCPSITLGPATLPSGLVESPYSQSLTASGGRGPYTFGVTAGALPTGLSLSGAGLLNGTPSTVGTNSFTVTAADTNGCSGSQVCTLAVTGVPPVITLQPQSRTNVAGTAASFTGAATGTVPLSYQWQFNGGSLTDNDLITGATSTALAIAIVEPGDAGSYTLVVSNVAGVVTSAVATLTVTVPPAINVPPASRSVSAGAKAAFSVTASGTLPLAYQWQFNGADIAGATGAYLILSNVQLTNAGSYDVVVTNSAGSVTSAVAVLTVLSPPAITGQPQSRTNVTGTTATFSVTATGAGPLSYQWRLGGTSLANDGRISGATAGTLQIASVQTGDAGNYTVVISNAFGALTSEVASLTVLVPPAVTVQPANFSTLAGSNVSFSVTASGTAPLSYQWRFNGADMGGATGTTLLLTNVQPGNAGTYVVVVTNVAGSATSAVATLTVTLQAACVPSAAGLVGWWPGDGNANDIASTNNGALQGGATAGATGLVGSAFSFDGTNGYVQIPDAAALRPTNLTIEAWVRFNSLDSPALGGVPAGEQYLVFKQNTHSLNFEGFALTKVRGTSRDLFDFQVSSASGQSAELTSVSALSTGVWYHVAAVRGSNYLQLYVNGRLESQTNVNFAQDYGSFPLYFGTSGQSTWDRKLAGMLDEVSLYSRALSSNEVAAVYAAGADGKCKGVTITAQPQSQAVAVGANVSLTVAASGSLPLSYEWQRDGVSLVDGGNISGAWSPALSLVNVSASDSANYRVIVANVVGVATSAVAVLQVVPTLGPPSITTQPASQTAAAGTNVAFTVAASGSGPLSYQWRFNGTSLANGGQFSGATSSTLAISYVLPANSGGYSVVVTNAAGAVTSAVATLTVNPPTGCLAAPTGLVGWWPGDGSARDIIGTNNGTLQGNAVANAAGFIGQAFSFDGTNGYAQIPDSPVFHPTNLTVECWVRFDAYQTPGTTYYSNQQYIVFKQNSRSAEFEGFALTKDHDPQGDVFLWEVASSAGVLVRIDSVSTVVTGVWYHVAGVRGPNYVQLYKDGQLEVQTNVDFPQDYGTFPLYFGTSGQSYYDRRMHGELDEVGLYNRALSAGEIAALYAAGAAGKCKGTNGISITAQPQSQTVLTGSNVLLTVSAAGIAPLSYQWQFNGVAIPGATSTNLALVSVQSTNAGNYQALVSNPAGSVLSVPAVLTVLVPPGVTLQPTNETVTAGDTASFSAAASGTAPLSYQWRLNGTNLDAAASQTLSLTNVQPEQAGSYSVMVTNLAGWATSEVATLTVLVPPGVALQPTNETVVAGGTASFSATASGTAPLGFQWQFNGASLDGASAETLILTNVQAMHAGSYSIVVTNDAGAVTSAVAVLKVAGPPSLLNARTTAGGTFAFTLSGGAGLVYVIEVTTNLLDWTPLGLVTNITGQADFTDAGSANSLSRFYRARLDY